VIAVVDGPLPADRPAVVARHWLADPSPASLASPAARHAAALLAAIRRNAPTAGIVSLVVFTGGLACPAERVARAFDRAAGAAIALCAFGMGRHDAAVARAAARLQAAGTILVAAAPARGDPVYPAALPGVVAVQGDARCGPGDWSHLGLATAEFGACPRSAQPRLPAGASLAAAHFAGLVAARLAAGDAPAAVLTALRRDARHLGRERRCATLETRLAKAPDGAASGASR